MSLLIDQVRERGTIIDLFQEIHANEDYIKRLINYIRRKDDLAVFDVSGPMLDYVQGKLHIPDLPGFRLPFEECWFEGHETHEGEHYSWGIYVQECDPVKYHLDYIEEIKELNASYRVHIGCLFATMAGSYGRVVPNGPIAQWTIGINEDGSLGRLNKDSVGLRIHIVPMSGTIVDYCREQGWESHEDIQLFIVANYILPLYAGIGMLNIRNIEAARHDIPEKLNTARIRRKKPPYMAYHTLVVRPLSASKNQTSTGHLSGVIPFHAVRGHPVKYTADAPRFGRAKDGVGTFWIEGHARGNKAVGEVKKDYRIDADKRRIKTTTIKRDASYRGPELWAKIREDDKTEQAKPAPIPVSHHQKPARKKLSRRQRHAPKRRR